MVFASICEHANTAFFFASTSSDQICLASSEHFRKYNWRTANTSISFPLILHVGLLGCPYFCDQAIISRPAKSEFEKVTTFCVLSANVEGFS